jgi:hypothetical protein
MESSQQEKTENQGGEQTLTTVNIDENPEQQMKLEKDR